MTFDSARMSEPGVPSLGSGGFPPLEAEDIAVNGWKHAARVGESRPCRSPGATTRSPAPRAQHQQCLDPPAATRSAPPRAIAQKHAHWCVRRPVGKHLRGAVTRVRFPPRRSLDTRGCCVMATIFLAAARSHSKRTLKRMRGFNPAAAAAAPVVPPTLPTLPVLPIKVAPSGHLFPAEGASTASLPFAVRAGSSLGVRASRPQSSIHCNSRARSPPDCCACRFHGRPAPSCRYTQTSGTAARRSSRSCGGTAATPRR